MTAIEVKLTIEFSESAERLIKAVSEQFGQALNPMLEKLLAALAGTHVQEPPRLPSPKKEKPPRAARAAVADSPYTAERLQLIASMRAAGNTAKEILKAANLLPGTTIKSENTLSVAISYYKKNGKLPEVSVSKAAPAAASSAKADPPPVIPKPPPVKPASPSPRPAPVAAIKPLLQAAVTREPPIHLAGAGNKMIVDTNYARQWAAERGLCNGGAKLDLPMVNKKRRDLGQPEFELKEAARA